jgi:hypothetical protein
MRHDQCNFCAKVSKNGIVKDGKFFCDNDHYEQFLTRDVSAHVESVFDYLEGWVLDSIIREGYLKIIQNHRFFLLLESEGGVIQPFGYDYAHELTFGIQKWSGNHGEGDATIYGVYDKESENKEVKYSVEIKVKFD